MKKQIRIISTFLSMVMLMTVLKTMPLATTVNSISTPCTFGGVIASPSGGFVNLINGNAPGSSGRGNLEIDVLDLISGTCINPEHIYGIEAVIWGDNTENRQAYIDVNGVASPRFHASSSFNADYLWSVMSHGNTPNNGGRTQEQTLIYMNQYGGNPKVAGTSVALVPFVSENSAEFDVVIRPTDNHASLVTEVSLLGSDGNKLGTSTYSTQDAGGVWSTFVPDCECCQFCGFDPCECFIDELCRFGGMIDAPLGGFGNFVNGNAEDTNSRASLDFDVLELIAGTPVNANDIHGIEVVTWGDNTENRQVTIEVNGVASPRFHGSTSPHVDRIWAIMAYGNTPDIDGRTEQNTLRYMNIYGSTTDIQNNLVPITPFVDDVNPSEFIVRIRANDNHSSLVTAITLLDETGEVLGATTYSTQDDSGSWSLFESLVEDCICGNCEIGGDDDNDDNDNNDDNDDDDDNSDLNTGINTDLGEYEYDDYTVSYEITNSWVENGVNKQTVHIIITNTGSETIENWMVAYNFHGTIEGIWNAAVMKTEFLGLDYVRNMGHNANILPGQSVNFGYTLTGFKGVPNSIVLCQERFEKTSGFSVELNVNHEWTDNGVNGFLGEIVLTNETDKPIEWWELSFDSNFTVIEIMNSWAATMDAHGGGKYTLTALDYTGIIPAYSSAVLGFQAIKDGVPEIWDAKLSEVTVDETALYQAVVATPENILIYDNQFLYSISRESVTIHGFAYETYNNDVIIPDQIEGINVTEIGIGAFMGTTITSIVLPDTITEIGGFAFEKCENLTEIMIPNRVIEIGDGAFYASGLVSAMIGGGVAEIGIAAFGDCKNLETLTFKSAIPPIFKQSVLIGSNPIIYVPIGTKSNYRSEPQLSEFRYVEYDLNGNSVFCDDCNDIICLCEYVIPDWVNDDSLYDGNKNKFNNYVYAKAVYDSLDESIIISWGSHVVEGTFEIFNLTDNNEWHLVATVKDESSYEILTDGTDFIVEYFKVIQTLDDDTIVSGDVCYAVWSPVGVNWTEYTREWTIDANNRLLSEINDSNDYYEFSVNFKAAGVPEMHFIAAESIYSNAIKNDSIFGDVPGLIYQKDLTVSDVEVRFELKDGSLDIENLIIFKWFDEANMLLPIDTSYEIDDRSVYAMGDDLGTYCLIDIDEWLSMVVSNGTYLGFNWSELELTSPLLVNGSTISSSDVDDLTDWEKIDRDFIEKLGISLPSTTGTLVTDEHLPTLSHILSVVYDCDLGCDSDECFLHSSNTRFSVLGGISVLPVIADPISVSTAADGITNRDKLRILPVHDVNCSARFGVNGKEGYGRIVKDVCVNCKPGILERYNGDNDIICDGGCKLDITQPCNKGGFLYNKCRFEKLGGRFDISEVYNEAYDEYLNFYIDYEHYISRLGSRYLGDDENSTTLDVFKAYTVESLFTELEDGNINSSDKPVYYDIEGNKITIKLSVQFTGEFDSKIRDEDGNTVYLGDDIMQIRKDLIKDGMTEYWSGTFQGSVYDFFPGMKVEVEIDFIECDHTSGGCFEINVTNGISNGSTSSSIIIGETQYLDPNNEKYNIERYKWGVAHYLGHFLGLLDAYPKKNEPDALIKNEPYALIRGNEIIGGDSVMRVFTGSNSAVVLNDIEMLLLFRVKDIKWPERYIYTTNNDISMAIREKQIFERFDVECDDNTCGAVYADDETAIQICECKRIGYYFWNMSTKAFQSIIPYKPGDVTGNGAIGIDDALEILKYLAGMDNVMTGPNKEGIKCENAFNAGRVMDENEPGIADVLEILKWLAKMTSELDKTWGEKS